ncbi:MAG: hypothetical protein DHS20C05_00820 [Hyphococcus sp.]|nr:MAG: hypothetical protein DHS20C05_00820 [Marinicaulis sp.]
MAAKTSVTETVEASAPKNLIAHAVAGVVWVYKRTLSPVLYFFGARCRHYPTCSEYAVDAFSKHHPWRAFWLSLSRILRCHPFGSHGIDPVPDEYAGAWWQIWRLGDWAWTERGGDK